MHELGHKHYHSLIESLAKKEGLKYNVVEEKVYLEVSKYIKNMKSIDGDFLMKRISKYASLGYEQHKITELVAECFSVRMNSRYSKEIIEIIERMVK